MRIFIAIEIKDAGAYLKKIQEQIPDDIAKIKPVDAFHLTLKFIGETEKKEEIKEALSKIDFSPFKLRLDGLGVFPSRSFVKVVWIGIEDSKQLEDLQKKVEDVLERYHFRKDFEFKAHATLARVRFIKDRKMFLEKIDKIAVEPRDVGVDRFKLIKSELTPEGPIYEDIGVFEAKDD